MENGGSEWWNPMEMSKHKWIQGQEAKVKAELRRDISGPICLK